MKPPPTLRPLVTRQHSRVPGGFPGGVETDEEPSPTKSTYDDAGSSHAHSRNPSTSQSASKSDSSPTRDISEEGLTQVEGNSSMLDENEMSKKLMDVESSFLPELSPVAPSRHPEADDSMDLEHHIHPVNAPSSQTPPSSYKTPAPIRSDIPLTYDNMQSSPTNQINTSALETMSSSPTAAAAARTVSRVVSLASMGGYETAEENGEEMEDLPQTQDDATPRKSQHRPVQDTGTPTPTRHSPASGHHDHDTLDTLDPPDLDSEPFKSPRRRPQYLNSRFASQRSSYSSNTTTASVEIITDTAMGSEYALQTGGGTPLKSSSSSRPDALLSRSISLGSMASGVSVLSDGEDRIRNTLDLRTLHEEESPSQSTVTVRRDGSVDSGPLTPRLTAQSLDTPTDTVINQHFRDLEVPGTVARRFWNNEKKNGDTSSDRKATLPTPANARVKNLTLKEQGSLIDKLQKENWKLKLKLYFMDQMLTERSDEAVKAMVSENVELKTLKFSSTKEIRGLKRSIKELESKLKERDERLAARSATARTNPKSPSAYSEVSLELESQVTYLQERMENYRVEIERLRSDNAVKEGEKRKFAEMARSATERSYSGSDIETREEVAMWKDLLEAETARKEQAEDENKRLQDELWQLRSDSNHAADRPQSGRRPYSSGTSNGMDGTSRSSVTLVDQLKLENAELRRDLGAQTSMLTSRNREKERLYAEIEDLKMGQRRGGGSRSVAGESIFERSASRAQDTATSRTSSKSRLTQIADSEREAYENANGELRDQVSELKLENQELATQLDRVLDELERYTTTKDDYEKLQRDYDEMTEQTNREILEMQSERDEALQLHEEADLSFQDLRTEAQERIDALEDELDQHTETIKHLEQEMAGRDEESNALKNEIRMTSEGLDKIEADVQAKVRQIKELELENEDIARELESIENSLIESNGKKDKLTIELESRDHECAFLREEQDGYMLKIGDLESALQTAQASLSSEKDRTRDLDTRLAEERHQREVIGSKEKQEVQKIMNDLNREATTSQDETRKLKKAIETREVELKTWKERFTELESSLQEVLDDKGGSRSSFIHAISKLQRDLESTESELTATSQALSEKEQLLQKRDSLLESHGLESRKLSELLEKERSSRRADKAQHEQWQKSHQHTSRTLSQRDVRITELESGRQSDRKKLANLEQQFKDQLTERNTLLLNLWNRLSVLCGSDWQHQNNLVSGHLPTLEVINSMLPGFSQNLLSAMKTVEGIVGNFRSQIKSVERDLTKDYQQLEHNLDLRIKRLDRLESAVQVSRVSGVASAAPEIAKLRGENRLLKSELAALQKQEQIRLSRQNAVTIEPGTPTATSSTTGSGSRPARTASTSLTRGYSTTAVETLQQRQSSDSAGSGGSGGTSSLIQSKPLEPSQQRWIHRLRELERRLKAEREARLMDRSGARQRLEEGRQENEELRKELEREKERNRGE